MTAPSFLLTAINTPIAALDTNQLAEDLGLSVYSLGERQADIAGIIADDPISKADSGVLVVGTGEINFDTKVAAGLGVAVIIACGDAGSRAAELARRTVKELGATLAGQLTASQIDDRDRVRTALNDVDGTIAPVMSAELFENQLLNQARSVGAHIVLPEGGDDRILLAAHQLLSRDIAKLTILGDSEDINSRATEMDLDLSKADIIDHTQSTYAEDFASKYAELREDKGVDMDQARETMKDISYFGTMMVHTGLADGMVSGAQNTTAHTIKPSFQIIKTTPEASVVSSIFLMVMRGRLWAFGDCAVNPNPSAEQLGEIAAVSAKTAAQFGIDPKVALLSYSTGTSGGGPDVDRVADAVDKAREINSDLRVEGPLQFDAACDPGVAKKKMPDSEVAGHANVFIFPDLDAGNIGYKTAQRTGGALAIGPILQGLNKPVNDLSRGATVADIVNTVAITAIQAGGKN